MPGTFIFTISSGRSGTRYLSELLRANLADVEARHEVLGIGHFGFDTPDLSHLTLFNSTGNVPHVAAFWRQKFATISRSRHGVYAETSHLLIKAGLAENLRELPAQRIALIDLRRDVFDTLKSFAKRNDFVSSGSTIMWYLTNAYRKNLLAAPGALSLSDLMAWYVMEMRCRGAYYQALFEDAGAVEVVRADLEDIVAPAGAAKLLEALRCDRSRSDVAVPPASNESSGTAAIPPDFEQRLLASAKAVAHVDADRIGREAFTRGVRF